MKKHRLMNHQKYFRTLCFGLSFLTAACTNESPLSTEPAEWPKTSISIQATVDTKAANEPETAADNGTITRAGGDKQVPAGYRLRCKLEVYSKTTDLRVAQAQLFIDDNSGLTGAITFPDVHLPPNDTYKAICWADYIAAGTETDLIYNTSKGLSDIRLIETIGTVHAETAANEADIEDAYAGQSETFTIEASGAVKEGDEEKLTSIKLRRPFVKLSLPWVKLTTEDGSVWTDALRNIRLVYETGKVLYTQFNAWTGEASGARTVSSALYSKEVSSFNKTFALHDYLLVPVPMPDAIPLSFHIEAETTVGTPVTFKRYGSTATDYSSISIELPNPNYMLRIKGATAAIEDDETIYPLTFKEYIP